MFVVIALGIVYTVWGSTYLAIRIVVEEMPTLVAAGIRFLTAGILVAAALAAYRGWRRLAVTNRELLGCALTGLLLPVEAPTCSTARSITSTSPRSAAKSPGKNRPDAAGCQPAAGGGGDTTNTSKRSTTRGIAALGDVSFGAVRRTHVPNHTVRWS